MQEVDIYIKKLTAKFGAFVFPDCKTLFDPYKEEEQLEQMIPNYRSQMNALINKKSTSNSDLTYKIVKTADNHLSIFKKNDTTVQHQEAVHEKATPSVEHKISSVDDLKYQVMKRDKEKSRVDGRVDSVILKRKAESPISSVSEPVSDNRKKTKFLTNYRRMSTSTEFVNVDSAKINVPKIAVEDEQSKVEKPVESKSSSKSSDTPTTDSVNKQNSKEDLITAVVKKLDKLQKFVSTTDKVKVVESNSPSDKITESEPSIESGSSNEKPITAVSQENEPNSSNNLNPVVEPNLDNSNEDENLLVPMLDPSSREMDDSKKDIVLAPITSNRQGSMSGSSIQSVTGSLDESLEVAIKTEPLSGDDDPNDNKSSEKIVTPIDNCSQNGLKDSNVSKISVKNISSMTKPVEPVQRAPVAVRKMEANKSGRLSMLLICILIDVNVVF